jgi:hypothetical protein
MLSIGKVGLTRRQQLYYEEKVAKGAEDYDTGRGEMPGRWTGSGARLLGLTGELDLPLPLGPNRPGTCPDAMETSISLRTTRPLRSTLNTLTQTAAL